MENQMIAVKPRKMLEPLLVAFPQTLQIKNFLNMIFLHLVVKSCPLMYLLHQPITIFISDGVKIPRWWMSKRQELNPSRGQCQTHDCHDWTKAWTQQDQSLKALSYKSVRMLNSRADSLEQILSECKPIRDVCGLGFLESSVVNRGKGLDKEKQKIVFVKEQDSSKIHQSESSNYRYFSENNHQSNTTNTKFSLWKYQFKRQ